MTEYVFQNNWDESECYLITAKNLRKARSILTRHLKKTDKNQTVNIVTENYYSLIAEVLKE